MSDAGAHDGATDDAAVSEAAAPADGGGIGACQADKTIVSGGLTALQKKKAEMLTSIWENSTTKLQYGYCQDIDDGRGYTCGRAGFCTGCGDLLEVVTCFDTKFGTGSANLLFKYLPALTRGDDTPQIAAVGMFAGSPPLPVGDWYKTATDPATAPSFNGCQDEKADEMYFTPAMETAKKYGVQTALTKAELYDAAINHGSAEKFAQQATAATGVPKTVPAGDPLSIEDESKWLQSFLALRLAVLAKNRTWKEAVDRDTLYEILRRQGNWDLCAPIVTDPSTKAMNVFPGMGYIDSVYPNCTIAPDGTVSGDDLCNSPFGNGM